MFLWCYELKKLILTITCTPRFVFSPEHHLFIDCQFWLRFKHMLHVYLGEIWLMFLIKLSLSTLQEGLQYCHNSFFNYLSSSMISLWKCWKICRWSSVSIKILVDFWAGAKTILLMYKSWFTTREQDLAFCNVLFSRVKSQTVHYWKDTF